jgi:serine palmitoyltransferase
VKYLRYVSPGHLYATAMSPPAVQQVLSALKVLMGEDGTDRGMKKLAAVRENSNFFREELQKMGCEVLGDEDSPIMPIMLYIPATIPAFSRECLARNVCVLCFPFLPFPPLFFFFFFSSIFHDFSFPSVLIL